MWLSVRCSDLARAVALQLTLRLGMVTKPITVIVALSLRLRAWALCL